MIDLSDLFIPVSGINLEYNKMVESTNGIPFVGRTSQNNGVVGYVEKIEDVTPNPAMTISLSAGGSVLESFFQKKEYYSAHHVYCLQPKIRLTENQMLYYCMVIRANKYKYSFGRQANKTLHKIRIPSVDEIPSYVDKVRVNKPSDKSLSNAKINLNHKKWKWFSYSDIFNISGTTTTPLEDLNNFGKGMHPYVTTQAVNNGVEDFFAHSTESGNVLCIDSAVIGYCSYQENDFSASDHVEKLQLIEKPLNKYIAIFLMTIVNLEQYRYSYGRKRSQKKLKTEWIKLPVDGKNNPDWQFMENYIKSLPYSSEL